MTAVGDSGRPVVSFDADVLIYAAMPRHPLAPRIRALFDDFDAYRLVGSALLPAAVFMQPSDEHEAVQLEILIAQMEIWPITDTVGYLAAWLGSQYSLAPMDATHLACAVDGGADVFLTNNRKTFRKPIGAIDIVYPDELPVLTRSRR